VSSIDGAAEVVTRVILPADPGFTDQGLIDLAQFISHQGSKH